MEGATKGEALRELVKKAVSTYMFRDGASPEKIADDIKQSYWQFTNYFCKSDVDRNTAKALYGIITSSAQKKPIDLSKYSTKQLWQMATLMKREYSDGSCTYDFHVFWYGSQYYTEAEKMMQSMTETGNGEFRAMDSKEKFVADIASGRFYDMIKEDFSDIQLLNKDTYMEYLEYTYRTYTGLSFGSLGNYMLEFVGIGYLDPQSLVNSHRYHVEVTDNVGFRLRNTKTGKILKTETYADVTKALSRAD